MPRQVRKEFPLLRFCRLCAVLCVRGVAVPLCCGFVCVKRAGSHGAGPCHVLHRMAATAAKGLQLTMSVRNARHCIELAAGQWQRNVCSSQCRKNLRPHNPLPKIPMGPILGGGGNKNKNDPGFKHK